MLFPKEYIDFLVHFHSDRDYFECHEILEEFWRKADPRNKHSIWVGFIQLAVAQYHHRRGNFAGAFRMAEKSLLIFSVNETQLNSLGIEHSLLITQVNRLLADINHHQAYRSINLPLISDDLMKLCYERCSELKLSWGSQSDLSNNLLIHRHNKRDRSSVIEKRNLSLAKKRTKEANS